MARERVKKAVHKRIHYTHVFYTITNLNFLILLYYAVGWLPFSLNCGSLLWILVDEGKFRESRHAWFRQREYSARYMLAVSVPCLRFYLIPLVFPLPKYLQYTLISPRSCINKGIKTPTVLHFRIRTLLETPSKSVIEIIHPSLLGI